MALFRMILIPASVVTLILLGVIALSFNLIQSKITEQQGLVIALLARQGNQYLKETDRLMNTLAASLPELLPGDQRQLLHQARLNYPRFSDFYLLDETGRVQMEETSGHSLLNLDLSGASYFRAARTIVTTYFSEPFISPTTGKVSVTAATPIYRNGALRGVLVGELDLEALQDFIEQVQPSEQGVTFIVDQNGDLVAHTEHSWVEQHRNLDNLALVQKGLAGQAALEVYYDDELESWMVGSATLMDNHWSVAISQPVGIVAQPLIVLAIGAAVALGFSFLLLFVVQLRSAQRMTEPISQLARTADDLARGNYQKRPSAAGRSYREINSLSQSFAQMAEAVMERDRLLEQRVRDRTRRLQIIATLGEQINALLDPDEILSTVTQQIAANVPYQGVCCFWIDEEGHQLRAKAAAGALELKPPLSELVIPLTHEDCAIADTARLGKIIVIDKSPEKVRHCSLAVLPAAPAELCIPLFVQEQTQGVLFVQDGQPGAFDASSIDMFRSLANQINVALHNAYLYAEMERLVAQRTAQLRAANESLTVELAERQRAEIALRQSAQRLALLHSVDGAILSAQSIEAIAQATLVQLKPVLPSANSQVLLFDGGTPQVIAVLEDDALIGGGADGPSEQLAESARVLIGLPYHADDLTQLDRPTAAEQALIAAGVRSVLAVPLVGPGGPIGVLRLTAARPQAFSANLLAIALEVADQLTVAIQDARLREQTQHYAEDLERRVAERTRELAEANAQLTELDQLKSKFVSDVSHELRTPIANLKLYTELLQHGRSDKQPQYLKVLQEQAHRLTVLVDNILDLSRLERRKQVGVHFEPVNINDVIEPVMTAHQPRAEAAHLALEFVPAPNLPLVKGDANQLSQVITNLVANALNYTRRGAVRVQTLRHAGQVGMRVTDSGSGIDPEDSPHIFERFYRGRRVRKNDHPGTGLGLAIVKEIVELHHGRIDVESMVDEGTTVTVWLPAEQNETAPRA